jgi:membrane associated rhomboid family serine protease
MAPLFAQLTAEQARIYALVLASAGIRHTLYRHQKNWAVEVPAEARGLAVAAIAAYRRENPDKTNPTAPPITLVRTHSAIYAALILIAIHAVVAAAPAPASFVAAYGADAGQIVNGQIYRCLTALLLHADGAHLAANVAATLLFGTYAAALCGWGVGWLLIVCCGAGGNLLTALWYGQGHRAIGASTAVFAAVGICVAQALWRHKHNAMRSWRSWVPLAGGLALVGWLGTAPHSDLLAHLMGFACGLVGGGCYARMVKGIHAWPIQAGALGLVALGIVGGWYWGMVYSG